jgi:hypothetical protein
MNQSRTWHVLIAMAAVALLAPAGNALAGPAFGFHEEFLPADGIAGFTGGAGLTNPGTGGRDGDGDGYLRIAREPLAGNLGAYNPGVEYAGDYIAAGVTKVVFWLNDVEADQALEIHLGIGIGGAANFWQYDTGFAPPNGTWAAFEVDLTDSTNFTQTHASPGGNYTQALRAANRLLWRHDVAPYVAFPDGIAGQVGLDGIFLTNAQNAIIDLPAPPVTTALSLTAFPNPAAPMTSIAADLAAPADVRLRVVSAAGRVVREIYAGRLGAGRVAFPWDGRDESGARVSAGVYFLNLTAGDLSAVERIAVIP